MIPRKQPAQHLRRLNSLWLVPMLCRGQSFNSPCPPDRGAALAAQRGRLRARRRCGPEPGAGPAGPRRGDDLVQTEKPAAGQHGE